MVCKDCGKKLVKSNWPHWRKRTRHKLCYQCGLVRYRKRYKKVSADICQKRKAYRLKLKQEFVKAYGGKCDCCGEDRIEFLTVAHLNNDGAKHRKEIGGSNRLHTWLKKNNYPKGFGVLCFNCNASDYYYGGCPHKKSFRLSSGLVKG